MVRAWRIEYEGALYHVLAGGNERRDIFLDDDDRTLFLTVLGEAGERFAVDVEESRGGGRVSHRRSLERDLLLYLIRQMGVLTDPQLGAMFGLGYPAMSRRAGIFKAKLLENKALQRKYGQLKSRITTRPLNSVRGIFSR